MTANTSMHNSNRVFDEFSPKKLILQGRSAFKYVLSRWKLILLAGILLGAAAAIYTFFTKPNYQAEITFAIDEVPSEPAAKSTFSEISDELGLGTTLDGGTVFSSLTNIVELMQSRLLIEKTLRSAANIDGTQVVFADFFLDSLDYRDKWMKNSPYYHINFQVPKKDKKEILFENNIMRNIYEVLTTKNIKIDKKGKGTTIISVTCISEHELFSKYFLEAWLDEVAHYYVETKTQRAKNFLDFIQKRTDSVKTAYSNALYGRASYADAHSNAIRQTVSVSVEKQQTDVQILRTSYVELVKSLESARSSLMRETPLIQFLDTPILPLKMQKPSFLKRFILFFIVGAFLMTVLVALGGGYRYILQSGEEPAPESLKVFE
jgi:Chain length determinant protein